ncbi:hypothetical protein BD414DRAFT_494756 [Trametes punicea]|nr:hypothetical protein BD414DRAFT_494756 [Trametes punicea]
MASSALHARASVLRSASRGEREAKLCAFNRVFLLTFNNGAEAAVRIPFPIVGNVGRSVASEVATMCYVRERLRHHRRARDIPFPPKSSHGIRRTTIPRGDPTLS